MKGEKELINELKYGSVDAFDQIFKIYGARIYKFALSVLKSREDSEEIVQDTFYIIWVKRKTIELDRSFKSYVFTIAYHKIITTIREKLREKNYRKNFIMNATDHFDLQEIILSEDLHRRVDAVIQNLPPKRKEIFILRKDYNLNYKEIATKLGISSKTVENNINLAIKYIKSRMVNDSTLLILFFSICIK